MPSRVGEAEAEVGGATVAVIENAILLNTFSRMHSRECIVKPVQSGTLFRLATRLQRAAMRASLEGLDQPATAAEIAVGADVAMNPDSTVSDIVTRTGLSQGAVSRVVARLREEGFVVVAKDPDDGRKTRIGIAPDRHRDTFVELGRRSPRSALAEEFGLAGTDAKRLEELLDQMWELAKR